MRALLGLLVLAATMAHAGEGRIVVTRTPMFSRPSLTAPIVKWVKLNDTIYIHPQVLVDYRKYLELAPDMDRRKKLEKELAASPEFQDGFLEGSNQGYNPNLKFVLTKDGLGRDAWVLRKHVRVWYEDEREFQQLDPRPDPTDYRLREPLPPSYPFQSVAGARGWAQFSLGSPWIRNYPYREKIQSESYGRQLEFALAFQWRRPSDLTDRVYVGWMLSVRNSESDYTLETRQTHEQWSRVGTGPILSYDPYRDEDNRITMYFAPLFYPYARAIVAQNDDTKGDSRQYWGWNASGRFGVQYSRIELFPSVDLILGVWSELEAPFSMRAQTRAKVPSWWAQDKGDKFNTGFTYTLAGQVGLQTSY